MEIKKKTPSLTNKMSLAICYYFTAVIPVRVAWAYGSVLLDIAYGKYGCDIPVFSK